MFIDILFWSEVLEDCSHSQRSLINEILAARYFRSAIITCELHENDVWFED
jgi:hypothetical protein